MRGEIDEDKPGGNTYKMRGNVRSKMARYLEPLLHVPSSDKYHWWFALILDLHYMNELLNVRELHEIESVDTRDIIR